MLRTCVRDSEGRLTAHGGFIWPAHGVVECPDWKPTKACGNGLHGFLPSRSMCTDNAAMIASAGWYRLSLVGPTPLDCGADPNLRLPTLR